MAKDLAAAAKTKNIISSALSTCSDNCVPNWCRPGRFAACRKTVQALPDSRHGWT